MSRIGESGRPHVHHGSARKARRQARGVDEEEEDVRTYDMVVEVARVVGAERWEQRRRRGLSGQRGGSSVGDAERCLASTPGCGSTNSRIVIVKSTKAEG
jgi:hypothetical protein